MFAKNVALVDFLRVMNVSFRYTCCGLVMLTRLTLIIWKLQMRIQNPVKNLTLKKTPIKFFYRILNTPLNYPQELLMCHYYRYSLICL